MNNTDSFDDLVVSIDCMTGKCQILIAFFDRIETRDRILRDVEKELNSQFDFYQVRLNPDDPSLYGAIARSPNSKDILKARSPVVSVLGAESIPDICIDPDKDGRSQQEIFFGYLQWTREMLREFSFTIVLWLPVEMYAKAVKKAPDFVSWSKGIFRFGN